jgi:hypothetical protein
VGRRKLWLIVGLIGVLALGSIAGTATAKKKKRIKSTVTISRQFDVTPPPGEFVYSGDVSARKRTCERRRTVTLYNEGVPGAIASTQTDADGHWEIRQPGDGLFDQYFVKVDRKPKKHLICKSTDAVLKPS